MSILFEKDKLHNKVSTAIWNILGSLLSLLDWWLEQGAMSQFWEEANKVKARSEASGDQMKQVSSLSLASEGRAKG